MTRTVRRSIFAAVLATGLAAFGASESARAQRPAYDVREKSIAQLQADLRAGRVTSEELVRLYVARIHAFDASGPTLHSVIALDPLALADARISDNERRAGRLRGPLQGLPILIKDNIETSDGIATTAGSDALARNVTDRDAPLVRRLRDAGAIVLGKTNLSEWANSRSSHSISGWSAVGGLVKNPYALDRSACGSSSGTGAAVAASLAAAGVGTETDGSVVCPSSVNGLVGLKPTVGLVSRTHVVPISHSQDTPGPMGRSVADVAALLSAMAGSDPADSATAEADAHRRDYLKALDGATLRGKRLGVLTFATGNLPEVDALFARAVAAMKARGATIVELTTFKVDPKIYDLEGLTLRTEMKADLNAYLATTPRAVTTRTLAAVIAFDRRDPRELGLFDQDQFLKTQAAKSENDPAYRRGRALAKRMAGRDGIDRVMLAHHLDALIAPGDGPAARIDVLTGDHTGGSPSTLPAVAGYPHLTVPMGNVRGMPVGLDFIGGAWSDARLLALGYAYERATLARRPPTYLPSIETTDPIRRLFAP